MKGTLKWILVSGVILVLLITLPALLWFSWGGRFDGMMRGVPMMNHGFGMWTPFGWLGMGLMWLLPLAVLVILALGLAGIFTSLLQRNPPPPQVTSQSRSCSNCGKPAQSDWQTCPYCSNPLT